MIFVNLNYKVMNALFKLHKRVYAMMANQRADIAKSQLVISTEKKYTPKSKLMDILYEVSRETGVRVGDIQGTMKHRGFVEARQIFCKRAKDKTRSTLDCIGETINKDHATVIHSIRMVEQTRELRDKYDSYFGVAKPKVEKIVEADTCCRDPIEPIMSLPEKPYERPYKAKEFEETASYRGFSGYTK